MQMRSLVKRLLSPVFYLIADRRRGLVMEAEFWDRWMAQRGGPWSEDFAARFDPARQVSGWHAEILRLLGPHPRILDVGAGPVTAIGRVWDGNLLDVTAVDPLAATYDALLAKHNLFPPVQTRMCAGEDLARIFVAGTFDWVNAQNCIDHAKDPIQAIRSMVQTCAEGGIVSLYHEENEAVKESWRGLHQWNFGFQAGQLTLSGRNGHQVVVDMALVGMEFVTERRGDHLLSIGKKRRTL